MRPEAEGVREVQRSLPVAAPTRLSLVVEERGRVNCGDRIGEKKGLIGPVRVGGVAVTGWIVTPVAPIAEARFVAHPGLGHRDE